MKSWNPLIFYTTEISVTFSIGYCQWYKRWLYSKAKANHKSLNRQQWEVSQALKPLQCQYSKINLSYYKLKWCLRCSYHLSSCILFFLQSVFTTECSIHCICMRMHCRPHVHLLVLCLVRILLDSSQWCDTGNMGTDFGNCISRTFRLITWSQLSAKIKNYPTRYCIMRLFFFFADVKCLIREAEEI